MLCLSFDGESPVAEGRQTNLPCGLVDLHVFYTVYSRNTGVSLVCVCTTDGVVAVPGVGEGYFLLHRNLANSVNDKMVYQQQVIYNEREMNAMTRIHADRGLIIWEAGLPQGLSCEAIMMVMVYSSCRSFFFFMPITTGICCGKYRSRRNGRGRKGRQPEDTAGGVIARVIATGALVSNSQHRNIKIDGTRNLPS